MTVYRVTTMRGTVVEVWQEGKRFFSKMISRTAQAIAAREGAVALNVRHEILQPSMWPPREKHAFLLSSAFKHIPGDKTSFAWWSDTAARVDTIES